MKLSDEPVTLEVPAEGANGVWAESGGDSRQGSGVLSAIDPVSSEFSITPSVRGEMRSVAWTFLTTLATFGIFLIQGVLLARILGPVGRGEFGTALFFPRDILLYAGLLGGIEVVNASASRIIGNAIPLKYSAAWLGLISGTLTGLAGAVLAVATICFTDVFYGHDKWYLLPYCLFCCLFVPIEHVQLNVSAVDRGKANYCFYNVNRLLYACAFPALLVFVFNPWLDVGKGLPFSDLTIVCGVFLLSRLVGILPTLRGLDLIDTLFNRSGTGVKAAEGQPHVPNAWSLLRQGRGYALSMFATELFERLDVLLIVALAPVLESGYYFVAVPVAAILTVAPNALGVFTFNAGADPKRKVGVKLAASVMAGTAVFQIVAALIYSVVMPYLIVTIFKPDFSNSVPYALWLLPACAMKGFLQAADGYLKGRGKPMIGVRSRVISIVVMLLFVWAAFSFFSFETDRQWLAIPMAACAGQAVSLVIISWAVLREARRASGSPVPVSATEAN